jgi:hypothetical protein
MWMSLTLAQADASLFLVMLCAKLTLLVWYPLQLSNARETNLIEMVYGPKPEETELPALGMNLVSPRCEGRVPASFAFSSSTPLFRLVARSVNCFRILSVVK